MDNVKVSQEHERGSTKEALSFAMRVHVTRSILPSSQTIQDTLASLKATSFSGTILKIYKAKQRIPSLGGRPQSWWFETMKQAGLFTEGLKGFLGPPGLYTTDNNILGLEWSWDWVIFAITMSLMSCK